MGATGQTVSANILSAPASNPTQFTDTGFNLPNTLYASSFYNDTYNGKLYLFGGNSGSAVSTIYYASASNPTVWTAYSPTPALPNAVAAATLVSDANGYLYLFGGANNSGVNLNIYRTTYAVSAAHPAATPWEAIGAFPSNTVNEYPSIYVDDAGGYIYDYGYINPSTGAESIARAPLANPTATSWVSLGTQAPYALHLFGDTQTEFQDGNNIYMLNPAAGEMMVNTAASSSVISAVGGFSLIPKSAIAAVYNAGGTYYAYGGNSGEYPSNGSNMLYSSTDLKNWTTASPPPTTFIDPHGGNYVLSEEPGEDAIFNTGTALYSSAVCESDAGVNNHQQECEYTASLSNPAQWTIAGGTSIGTDPSLPMGITDFTGWQQGTTWYTFGGYSDGLGSDPFVTSHIYTASTTAPTTWTLNGNIPASLGDFAFVIDSSSNSMYILGGYNNSGTNNYSTAVYAASTTSPLSWRSYGTLPYGIEGANAGIFADNTGTRYVYVFGGAATGGTANAIYRSPASSSLTVWTKTGTLPGNVTGPLVRGNDGYEYMIGGDIFRSLLTDVNNGSVPTGPLTATQTYTVSCLDSNGNVAATSTTVYVQGAVTKLGVTVCDQSTGLSCNTSTSTPAATIYTGGTANINYAAANVQTGSCNLTDNGTAVSATLGATSTIPAAAGSHTYVLTCTDLNGNSVVAGAQSNVIAAPLCSAASNYGATGTWPSCTCNNTGTYNSATNACGNPLCSTASNGGASGTYPTCLCTNGGTYAPSTNSCVNSQGGVFTAITPFSATPSRVHPGSTVLLNWSIANLAAGTSCGITANPSNALQGILGTTWSGLGTTWTSGSGLTTNPIIQATLFTLSCTSSAGTAASSTLVKLVPTVIEI